MCSATIPNCVSHDPTFGYEVAVIIAQTGCAGCTPSKRMSSTTSP